jgi:fructose transport system permease protein
VSLSEAEVEFQNKKGALNRSLLGKIQATLHTYPSISPLGVMVIAGLFFTIINPNFGTPFNLSLIFQQTAVVGTVAMGQTLIILTAGVDLSCGAVAVLVSMIFGDTAANNHFPGWLSLLVGLAFGSLAGFLNGYLITKLKLPPFIVTLGTFNVFSALTLVYSQDQDVQGIQMNKTLLYLGTTWHLGTWDITTGVILMVLLYMMVAYSLRFTSWGRHVYATGDDVDAARLAGIRTKRVLLSVYIVAGFIYAIAGWVLIGRTSAASANNGVDLNLDSITAVVIGGTSLFGGRGRIIGSLYGAIIVGVFQDGLTIAGLPPYYVSLCVGCLVILAVSLDQWLRKAQK